MKRLAALLFFAFGLLTIPASAQTCTPAQGPTNQHWVSLCWSASTTPGGGITYDVYRAAAACSTNPALTKVTVTSQSGLAFLDLTVTAGTTYCYAVTATQGGLQSGFSPAAAAIVPLTFPPAAPATAPTTLVN